jgi:hypothetical protein
VIPRSKARLIGLTLTVAFVLSAVVTSSANAAGNWFVTGTKLANGATLALASTAKLEDSVTFNVPSVGIKLTCTGGSSQLLKSHNSYIQGPNTGGAESLTYEGCSEISPAGCTIGEALETKPVVETVETGSLPLDRIKLSPKTGKSLMEIEFKGMCSLAGEKSLNGQVVLAADILQGENGEQPVEGLGTVENNSLELGGSKAYIENGAAAIKLASEKEFGMAEKAANNGDFTFNPWIQVLKGASLATFTLVSKVAGAKVKEVKTGALSPASQWGTRPAQIKVCEEMLFNNAMETCSWQLEYVGTKIGVASYIVKDENGGLYTDWVLGLT